MDRVADFDVDPTTPTPGVPALFTDRSSGPVIGWWWDFDDGTTSDAQNPTHAFASDGTYHVTLTAYYADGEESVTLPVNVGDAAAIFDDGFESGDLSAWN